MTIMDDRTETGGAAEPGSAQPVDSGSAGDRATTAGNRPAQPGGEGGHDASRAGGQPPDGAGADGDDRLPLAVALRPVLAAALASAAAGMVAGGIFGSWEARAWGLVAAFAGAAWALLSVRSPRTGLVQAAFPAVTLIAAAMSLVPAGTSPGELATAVPDAIRAGQLLRPPVPFDPGWRPIIVAAIGLLGFATGSIATLGGRPKLAVAMPMPVVLLMLTTQPDDQQFLAGVVGFIPVLAALAVIFGGDTSTSAHLDTSFELKRALRGLVALVPIVLLLVAVNSANFLFPEPVYDPDDQPQKPRAVPLSQAVDRVLFEVSESSFTGPWRAGVLDVYDPEDFTWKLPPTSQSRFVHLPATGALADERANGPTEAVQLTIRDLGDTAVVPILGGATRVEFDRDVDVVVDPRTDLLRVPAGRVPAGLRYTLQVPPYATEDQLGAAPGANTRVYDEMLEVPPPPVAVEQLLADAPDNPWQRLDRLRQALLKVAIAKGAGSPTAVPPKKVQDLLAGNHEGTPFEIVAAEALLARWAGVPSRIGFGFDGLNDEEGVLTVRPRNSAQWLEVYFEGIGWVPLVGAPQQAEASLDNDTAKFDPNVVASDEVSVKVYVPFEVRDITLLYERIRDQLIRWSPVIAAVIFGWLLWPLFAKLWRGAKRRRWASEIGPRAQVAVEYAEFRDRATDLGVADIYSTPLEYLFDVEDDAEHAAFAWLVARSLYGDKRNAVTEEDVRHAQELGASLRRRISRGQPVQVQVLGLLSKASLLQPYEDEMPNVRVPRLPRPGRSALRHLRAWRARRRKMRTRRQAERAAQRADRVRTETERRQAAIAEAAARIRSGAGAAPSPQEDAAPGDETGASQQPRQPVGTDRR